MKNNIENIIFGNKCTGCTACINICPKGAIKLKEDSEFFLIPQIDNGKCIDCGVCKRVCPEIQAVSKYSVSEEEYYIAHGTDKQTIKSASGGLFIIIAKHYLKRKNGVVFGAGFGNDNVVRHYMIDAEEELYILQNSKYVQSNLDGVFIEVKKELDKGKEVLFSGTGCQIAGLKKFLKMNYKNLITIDIICHGVPSPGFLKKEIEENSNTWKGKVKEVKFRYKNPFSRAPKSFYVMIMRMKRGLPIIRKPIDDPYFNSFLKGVSFRESCYHCQYACLERVGDFTLGDCDSYSFYPQFHIHQSPSTVMVNSLKAKKLWRDFISKECDWLPLDIKKEQAYNKQLNGPAVRPKERDNIYKDLKELTWQEFSEKYANTQSGLGKIRTLLSLIAPQCVAKLWVRFQKDHF